MLFFSISLHSVFFCFFFLNSLSFFPFSFFARLQNCQVESPAVSVIIIITIIIIYFLVLYLVFYTQLIAVDAFLFLFLFLFCFGLVLL